MTLLLHAGASPANYDQLAALPLPGSTPTHVPIAHSAVVDMVKYALGFYGHDIVQEDYGVTEDSARFFGVLSLKSEYGDYTDTVGLRNSHDKTFPIGISFGSRVFVCDNLAFAGDHVIRRKHTQNARRDLPGLVAEVVEPLRSQRLQQAQRIERYRHTALTQRDADHLVLEFYRKGVINLQRVDDVLEAYETPPHDWGDETAWRLFNATTFALTGRVAENPHATRQLHNVIDAACVH
jgi:hypothetical protein